MKPLCGAHEYRDRTFECRIHAMPNHVFPSPLARDSRLQSANWSIIGPEKASIDDLRTRE